MNDVPNRLIGTYRSPDPSVAVAPANSPAVGGVGKSSPVTAGAERRAGDEVAGAARRAVKFDGDKPDLSLLPGVFLNEVAKAMTYGAGKYGRYNYTMGFPTSRLIAAALRHIAAYSDGETNDPESNVSHLGHAAANMLMLIHLASLGKLEDNRNVVGAPTVPEKK